MNNLFNKFPTVLLGDLSREPGMFVDGPFGSNLKASEYVASGIPVARIQNVRANQFVFSDQKFITAEKAEELARHDYQPGDLVIAKMGDPPGEACVVPPEASSGIIVADVVRFRGRNSEVDHRYLAHFLNSPIGKSEFVRLTRGSTRQRVNLSSMKEIRVPLPSPAEQRRIAAILDKADAIRRKREQALALADDFLRSAYLHLVGMKHPDFLSWQPATIESLAEDKRGSIRSGPFGSALLHSEFVDEGIAVLGIDNAVKNKFQWSERRFITREKYEELRRYRVYPNDVIITIMGTTGRSAVVPDDIPEAITTKHLASITCDLGKVLPEFLSFAIHSDPVVIDQIRAANKGAIMDGLNLGIIRQIKIRNPPMRQQRLFADLLRKNHAAIQKMATPTGDGSDLFASLCQHAFRGEL
jgi:type I restriction enzyme S subunit